MKVFKTFIKPSEAPQRSLEIKIQVNILSSSVIVTGRVNKLLLQDNKNHSGLKLKSNFFCFWPVFDFYNPEVFR